MCLFPVSIQIITKIRTHDNPDVSVDVDGICDRIFDSVDKNKDSKFTITQPSFFLCCFTLIKLRLCVLLCLLGQITLEEFMEGSKKDPWVLEQLKLDIGPCDWFIDRNEK